MNDLITKPGLYQQRKGEKPASIVAVSDGVAFGFDSTGEGTTWRCRDGNWIVSDEGFECDLDIIGPWPKPSVDPGDGWRLLGDDEAIVDSDEMNWIENPIDSGWLRVNSAHVGKTQGHVPCLRFRRRIVPAAQPEWTPTNELRWRPCRHSNIGAVGYVRCSDTELKNAILEQRWTCGDKSEWRSVEVTK